MLHAPLDVVSTGVAPCALVRLQYGRRLLLLPRGRCVGSAGLIPRAVVQLLLRFAVLARFQRECRTACPCMPRPLHRRYFA